MNLLALTARHSAWASEKSIKKCNVSFERARHCTRHFFSGVLDYIELDGPSFQFMVLECWVWGCHTLY